VSWIVGVGALGYQIPAVYWPVVSNCRGLGASCACVCVMVWCAGADRIASEDACSEALLVGGAVSALPGGAPLPVCLGPVEGALSLPGGYCLGASGGGAGVHGLGHGYLAWMGQADQGSGRVQYGQSISPSSVSVVEGVVGDEPSVGAVVAGDGFSGGSAWAVVWFVGEAIAEGEDVHLVVVELECFPHGYRWWPQIGQA
jgi:hypothetical protein